MEPGLVLSPVDLSSEQKKERTAALVVLLPSAASYAFVLLVSVRGTGTASLSEEKGPRAAYRHQGMRAGRGQGGVRRTSRAISPCSR